MPSYRLLRSNKETGPYSLNDLVTMGLKPYDLIWVDGRSAAWRYPSEVAELKEFAPAIEEQPYDRFYKKSSESENAAEIQVKEPATSQHETISRQETISPQKNFVTEITPKQEVQRPRIEPAQSVQSKQEEQPAKLAEQPVKRSISEIPSPSFSPAQTQQKKKVFVSMPESIGFEQNFDQHKEASYQHDKYQQYLPKPQATQQGSIPQTKQDPAEERSYSPIDIHESDETKLETKYTQSLDDIKEMYINTLVQRKTKNRRKEIFRKYVRPAMLPLLLVLCGVAIGFVINYKKSSPRVIQSVSTVVPQQQATPQQKNSEDPIDNEVSPSTDQQQHDQQELVASTHKTKSKSITPRTEVVIKSQKQNKKPTSISGTLVSEQSKKQDARVSVPDEEIVSAQKKNVQVDASTGERKKVMRDNDEIDSKPHEVVTNNLPNPTRKPTSERGLIETGRKNIRDFVSVKSNNYVRGAFGGIRGLELTVYNRSGYLLDEVSVELQIMKPSEQPLRTDIITFRNINANGAVTVRVPDSQRGIRVDYRITNVESKQFEKSTAGL